MTRSCANVAPAPPYSSATSQQQDAHLAGLAPGVAVDVLLVPQRSSCGANSVSTNRRTVSRNIASSSDIHGDG